MLRTRGGVAHAHAQRQSPTPPSTQQQRSLRRRLVLRNAATRRGPSGDKTHPVRRQQCYIIIHIYRSRHDGDIIRFGKDYTSCLRLISRPRYLFTRLHETREIKGFGRPLGRRRRLSTAVYAVYGSVVNDTSRPHTPDTILLLFEM